MFAPPPTTWLAAVRAPYAPPMGGTHVCALRPGAPRCRGRPSASRDPTHACVPLHYVRHWPCVPLHRVRPRPCTPLLPCAPYYHSRPTRHLRPPPPRSSPTRYSPPCLLPMRHARLPCALMEAVCTLPRARFLSISSSKLMFILPLGHPGLQLPCGG
jgi:hypothetical protein